MKTLAYFRTNPAIEVPADNDKASYFVLYTDKPPVHGALLPAKDIIKNVNNDILYWLKPIEVEISTLLTMKASLKF